MRRSSRITHSVEFPFPGRFKARRSYDLGPQNATCPKSLQATHSFGAKCGAFTDFHLWPGSEDLNVEGWLRNFSPDEMPYALTLLQNFVYYPPKFVATLVRHAIHDLSSEITAHSTTLATAKHVWSNAFEDLFITRVTGENPNPTDSSYQFVRLARQHAGVPEQRIVEPDVLVATLSGLRDKTIVFLDDFVGSGNQCITTWHRPYPTAAGAVSFELIHAMGLGHRFVYLPLVATSYGIGEIQKFTSGLDVRPTHVLGDEYNCLHPKCEMWTSSLRPNVTTVLKNASMRAGIPESDWKGFHDLGLAFAFEGSIPDASLPLFYWDKNGWARLMTRR